MLKKRGPTVQKKGDFVFAMNGYPGDPEAVPLLMAMSAGNLGAFFRDVRGERFP